MNQILWIFLEFIFAIISVTILQLFVRSFLKKSQPDLTIIRCLIFALLIILKFITNLYFIDNVAIILGVSVATSLTLSKFYFNENTLVAVIASMFASISGAV